MKVKANFFKKRGIRRTTVGILLWVELSKYSTDKGLQIELQNITVG